MEFMSLLQELSGVKLLAFLVFFIVVWFLPALLALIFNRNQFKLIALACIPAGMSLIAWSALVAWAVTGKAAEKYLPEKVKSKLNIATN